MTDRQLPLRKLMLRAARVVDEVVGRGRNLDHVLQTEPVHGRPAVQDMAFSVLRNLGRLIAVRDSALSRELSDQRVATLLLVALQRLDSQRVEPHVVVNEAVEAAASVQPWARGITNAVLRRVMRENGLQQSFSTVEAQWNYPRWWVEQLGVSFPQHWQTILTAGNQHPPMFLRINRRKSTVSGYIERLRADGIAVTSVARDAVRLDKAVPVDCLPGFTEGDVSVQDLAAQRAARLLDVQDGMRVLDACAAPGGKTGHVLELANVRLMALDADGKRLERVASNLARLGLQAELVQGDAAQPSAWWDGETFDRILADVPCSASGVVRRHPDIRWLRRPEDIVGFAAQQAEILQALWPCLARGGKLLYVTCSVFVQENAEQIERFLTSHADARRVALQMDDDYNGQLLPGESGDGFYYAMLEKI